jgi:hypothetical protein
MLAPTRLPGRAGRSFSLRRGTRPEYLPWRAVRSSIPCRFSMRGTSGKGHSRTCGVSVADHRAGARHCRRVCGLRKPARSGSEGLGVLVGYRLEVRGGGVGLHVTRDTSHDAPSRLAAVSRSRYLRRWQALCMSRRSANSPSSPTSHAARPEVALHDEANMRPLTLTNQLVGHGNGTGATRLCTLSSRAGSQAVTCMVAVSRVAEDVPHFVLGEAHRHRSRAVGCDVDDVGSPLGQVARF